MTLIQASQYVAIARNTHACLLPFWLTQPFQVTASAPPMIVFLQKDFKRPANSSRFCPSFLSANWLRAEKTKCHLEVMHMNFRILKPRQHACRVDWDEEILAQPSLKEVTDSNGQTILKGMSAAIGICHGPIIKVCPHTTTGGRVQPQICPEHRRTW